DHLGSQRGGGGGHAGVGEGGETDGDRCGGDGGGDARELVAGGGAGVASAAVRGRLLRERLHLEEDGAAGGGPAQGEAEAGVRGRVHALIERHAAARVVADGDGAAQNQRGGGH